MDSTPDFVRPAEGGARGLAFASGLAGMATLLEALAAARRTL